MEKMERKQIEERIKKLEERLDKIESIRKENNRAIENIERRFRAMERSGESIRVKAV